MNIADKRKFESSFAKLGRPVLSPFEWGSLVFELNPRGTSSFGECGVDRGFVLLEFVIGGERVSRRTLFRRYPTTFGSPRTAAACPPSPRRSKLSPKRNNLPRFSRTYLRVINRIRSIRYFMNLCPRLQCSIYARGEPPSLISHFEIQRRRSSVVGLA